ncbi:MAG TPA: nuclear transport factor 2 family protein [Gaiellaceae bacterium]|nr:nuclear transport factor 2 family protein [Gaiellaceae bacterium]
MGPEDTIRRFCDAMNANDADAVAALAHPAIVIQIGPHRAEGIEALREMARQAGPETLDSRVEVVDIEGGEGKFEISARRVQRWAETNEIASEEELSVFIDLDERGLVTRAEMQPKPLGDSPPS